MKHTFRRGHLMKRYPPAGTLMHYSFFTAAERPPYRLYFAVDAADDEPLRLCRRLLTLMLMA